MPLKEFVAFATTCDVDPGTEEVEDGQVRVRGRRFTDHVVSDDEQVSGINEPVLDLTVNPQNGQGALQGRFSLRPTSGAGSWEGDLQGSLVEEMVEARGLARGTGAFDGRLLYVEFHQVSSHPGEAPCAEPKAFFEMRGVIRTP